MKDVDFLVGSGIPDPSPLPIFSPSVIDLLSDLSDALLKGRASRAHPDAAAVGFWCRRANIRKLADGYDDKDTRLGRGLAFHVAPSNIPVSFAFSLFFGLLSGNANIVRLPSRGFAQTSLICDALRALMPDHPDLASRIAIVRYPRESGATRDISAIADCRVVWGGDATVREIRSMPSKPRCVDVCFADRYSICIIDGEAIEAASDAVIRRTAEGFYNDTYLMDQNACSSPQTVLWLKGSPAARARFWGAVIDAASSRYEVQPMTSIDKYSQMCADSISLDIVEASRQGGGVLYRIELPSVPEGWEELRGVGGYFYECAIDAIDDVIPALSGKFQTITYFGVDPMRLRRSLIDKQARGVDRIVPIGSALDISLVWDGIDIIRTLSRAVDVR